MQKDIIQSDIKEALRAKDELKLSTLRMLSAAIKNFEIDRFVIRNFQFLSTLVSCDHFVGYEKDYVR